MAKRCETQKNPNESKNKIKDKGSLSVKDKGETAVCDLKGDGDSKVVKKRNVLFAKRRQGKKMRKDSSIFWREERMLCLQL